MIKGILLALAACLVWGLIFVVPGLMTGFSPLEVALGRYFVLGILSSALFLGQGLGKWKHIPWQFWKQAIVYGFVVNILYYFALVTGLRYSNASVIALLLGLSPITIAFYGNWVNKECSYKQLIIPSILIGIGLICVNWEAVTSLEGQATWEYGFGLLCGLFSLAAWNWYVVANSQFLKKNGQISSSDWATMIGMGTFVWVIAIVFALLIITPSDDLIKFYQFDTPLYYFLVGSAVLGLLCSWLGSLLWNMGSQSLPVSLAGQITIFETIFGLLFVYLLEASLPTFLEFLGIAVILAGVFLSMHRFRKTHAAPV